jgi:hypothetical protein
MIDTTKLPEKIQEELVEKYMEYPPKNKTVIGVIERHEIGNSQHFDFRFPVNNHLNGWAIVGFSKDNPAELSVLVPGKGFRAEPKCEGGECNEYKFEIYEKDGEYYYKIRDNFELSYLSLEELSRQPKIWIFPKWKIGERHTFKPGTVGAGVEKPGYMTVLARPKVKLGTQKPFYHEYFLKDFGNYKDWVRVIIRRIKGRALEPKTKVPTEKETLFWKFMIAKDPTPYAISNRAIKKGWKPPKDIIPFPIEWTKKNFPDKYKRWLEYMGKETKELSKVRFTLSLVSWMGPKHIRGTPRLRWFLFIDDKKEDKVRTFRIDGSPFRNNVLGIIEEERSNRKWLDYEGEIDSKTRWIETKRLKGYMMILDKGTVEYNIEKKDNRELIKLKFNGNKLKSNWEIFQDEPNSDYYTMTRKSTTLSKKLEFVYHKHQLKNRKPHYDIRIKIDNNTLYEINLWRDITEYKGSLGIPKICYDISWFIKEGKNIGKNVGNIPSKIDVIDYGTIEIIEDTPTFKSFKLNGKILRGYYVLRKEENRYYFEKSSLPGEERGRIELEEFTIEDKKGWNYFYIKVHDMRKYTRCTKDYKKYLNKIFPDNIEIYICFYHRPNKIHGAEVGMIKFYKENWDYNKAKEWIKSNNLHKWTGELIRS